MKLFEYLPGASRARFRAASVATVATLFSAGLLVALVAGAQAAATAVPLGTAENFAILAGSAITDVPTSTITGDVGVSPAAGSSITGLTCAEVTGTIYSVDATGPLPCRVTNPGLLTTAKNDLTTAYLDASGQSPDSTFSGGDNQLGGQTLVPGVYRFGGATTANLIGNLTLSGDASAIWIFQATSTLVTAGSSTVTFTGGAQACNVFWTVGSAATLGASSTFEGTILAHDDISLGDAVTVDGRLLGGAQASGAGAVTLIHDTITKPTCAAPPATTATTATTPTTAPTPPTTPPPAPPTTQTTTTTPVDTAAVAAAAVAATQAEAAKVEAAQAATAAQAAADEAAAAKVAAANAAEAANVVAAKAAAAKAAEAAKFAATKAATARIAAVKAAKAAKVAAANAAEAANAAAAKAAAAKAAKAARIAAAKAATAKAAAAKAAAAAKIASARAHSAKVAATRGYARPARQHVGFTG